MQKPATQSDWKEYLKACFDKSPFLALGSSSSVDGAWVNPVYFAFDDHFVIYFLSEPSCIHMQNIEHDDRVSCAIFNTGQDPQGEVLGVQLMGTGSWVAPEEAEEACAVYFAPTSARKPVKQSSRAQEYVKPDAVWRLAKVVPDQIWVFDEALFGGTRVRVSPSVYRS